MRATITVEFTDEELLKHAEDVGRRWTLNLIHDVINHCDANTASAVGQVLIQAAASVLGSKSTAPGVNGSPVSNPLDPGPTAARADVVFEPSECVRQPEDRFSDEGWLCCRCAVFNGVHREDCRRCSHARCGAVITPPPSSDPPEPVAPT
jgi:hypothetical protein